MVMMLLIMDCLLKHTKHEFINRLRGSFNLMKFTQTSRAFHNELSSRCVPNCILLVLLADVANKFRFISCNFLAQRHVHQQQISLQFEIMKMLCMLTLAET